jgi:hypothetical protein
MPLNLSNWFTIGTPSAWADAFRPSLGDVTGDFVSWPTFLSGTRRMRAPGEKSRGPDVFALHQ